MYVQFMYEINEKKYNITQYVGMCVGTYNTYNRYENNEMVCDSGKSNRKILKPLFTRRFMLFP